MSIRLRLTLLYSAILAVTLLALGVVLYWTVERVTLDTLADALRDDARTLAYSRPFRSDHEEGRSVRFASPQTYVQARAPDGTVLDRTPNLDTYELPLSSDGLSACRRGEAWTEVAAVDDSRLLIYSKPVFDDNQLAGILQVARSLSDYDQTLLTLRSLLVASSLVVIVMAFGAGWVIAGAALRPIHRITDTARAIGTHRDFERRVQYTGPPDEIGQLAGTFNTMLDELQDAHQQTEQSLHAQRRFVADASHELRTPLTTIRGNLGLLQRRPPIAEEDRDAVISDMVDETNRLIRLVNDLLVLARSDAGHPLRREAVELAPLIDDVCRQARLLGADRTIECENTARAVVIGDRDALKQVLLILLDNALKFTPAGGVIRIASTLNTQTAAVSIADTGPGIAPGDLPHIFERFYRSDVSRTGAGAGLGLAIAKDLVDAQAGQITVASEAGRGSTFTVTLPLRPT